MNTEDLYARATAELTARDGYRFNTKVLREVLERGELADGTVCMITALAGGAHVELIYRVNRFDKVVDGKVQQSMPMSDQAFEAALVMVAKREAQRAAAW